ncbi:MAG: methylthioribose-phosphate isomerase [Subtercola sp.]|nr:methylthioribose-phosphate isomerase [Subtercola sp.]
MGICMTTDRTDDPVLDTSVLFDGSEVRILDRRVFPQTISWVSASSAEEVAAAIRDMVTQSSGPLFAAFAAMELTAHQVAALPVDEALARLSYAGGVLATARPTNNHPREAVSRVLEAVSGQRSTAGVVEAALEAVHSGQELYRARSRTLGRETVALLDDGASILTHCWMDTYLIELVRSAREAGKSFRWIATETRPYLQGARLTAHTLAEMGERVTLITDGMGAAALAGDTSLGRIDALVTAADRVSLDGAVVNKVGTLGLAVAAAAFGVPFYALVQAPDRDAATAADIVVEERDPAEVLSTLGRRTASELVTSAWYPAFDVTPPRFVTGIVTDRGVFAPGAVGDYYALTPSGALS